MGQTKSGEQKHHKFVWTRVQLTNKKNVGLSLHSISNSTQSNNDKISMMASCFEIKNAFDVDLDFQIRYGLYQSRFTSDLKLF